MANRCFVLRASWFVTSTLFLTAWPPDRLTAQAPLEDNSFLIEEAYNQEARVVQHIATAQLLHGATAFTFTQEWPAGGMTNQLSYTIVAEQDQGFRFGDALLNYRWQAVGKEGAHFWVAPRLSGLVPVGNADKLGGNGGWGLEGEVPMSWEVGKRLSLHGNLGGTWRPSGENGVGATAATFEPYVGASAVIFLLPELNLMAESLWRDGATVVADGKTTHGWDHQVALGARAGFDLPSGLQIVPGVAWMPAVGEAPTRSFLYLSFEHKF
jgi:hypothetical protein